MKAFAIHPDHNPCVGKAFILSFKLAHISKAALCHSGKTSAGDRVKEGVKFHSS
jgi:hypothetical protein